MTDLTIPEVLAILSASSVDTSRLEFTEEAGDVVIRGPERDRAEAAGVLFAAGLAHAPYGDHDVWLRRQEGGPVMHEILTPRCPLCDTEPRRGGGGR